MELRLSIFNAVCSALTIVLLTCILLGRRY